jgi:hypothetical protein
MGSLSYQERSLYGELIADVAVFLPYFVLIHRPQQLTVGLIAGYIFLLIVAQIVLQTLIAVVTRDRRTDERDRFIRLRGYRAGYLTVVGFMVVGMGALWLHAALGQLNPNHMALHFLSVFFAVLMIAEIVKTVAQIAAYRRPI